MKKSVRIIVMLMVSTFLSGFLISNLHNKVQSLNKKVLFLESQIEQAKVKLLGKELALAEIRPELEQCKADNEQLYQNNAVQQKEIKRLNREGEIKRKAYEGLEFRLNNLEKDSFTLASINQTLDSQLKAALSQYTTLLNNHKQAQEEKETTIDAQKALTKFTKSKIFEKKDGSNQALQRTSLPENFGEMAIYVLFSIILLAIVSAGIQSLFIKRRRKRIIGLR